MERRKSWARFCFSFSWLHISEKKIVENCNSVGAGAQNVRKVVIFGPTLTLILPTFPERKNGKSYILKKVILSHLRRYHKNMYIIALSCFLTYFDFA